MALIKSISGIRGTIGGVQGENLTPNDIVKFTTAYSEFIKGNTNKTVPTIVVGRDARLSGSMVEGFVVNTLVACGCSVVNIGLATTPTTEIAVLAEHADGGVIITASHNPKEWNALKLLNNKGEFLSKADGETILSIAEKKDTVYCSVENIGKVCFKNYSDFHINKILSLELVDVEAIGSAGFSVAIDCVNSVGGMIVPLLLKKLGVAKVECINCDATGNFAHNPEPLKENLVEISSFIAKNNIDVGFAVDPDVDRLAIVCENGEMFGEEYTLVAVADYVLNHSLGNTVSNLSSTRALSDITLKHGGEYCASAVGEVNVVEKMYETNAVIGGEGNGGVIYPKSHYGRDALVGIALFLSYLAKKKMKVSQLKNTFPQYFISKNKIELTPEIDVEKIFLQIKQNYGQFKIVDIDGLKIDFPQGWVHLRKSNTEPIIRIYSEAPTSQQAEGFAAAIISEIKRIAKI